MKLSEKRARRRAPGHGKVSIGLRRQYPKFSAAYPMPPDVDFDSITAVSGFVRARFSAMYPGSKDAWITRLFGDIDALFAGRNPDYLPIDLRYHNLRHTLMATVC